MYDAVLTRVRSELRALGLDAYVAYTPSNFYYVTRYQSPYLRLGSWRYIGSALAVVPTDPSHAPAMIVRDVEMEPARAASPIADVRTYVGWSEARPWDVITGRLPSPSDFTRPAQYDPNSIFQHLSDILAERGLDHGRIGADLRYIQADSLQRMQKVVRGSTLVDMTDAMYSLRAIKLPAEVELLRKGAALFETGVKYAVSHIREGMTGADIRRLYEMGILLAVSEDEALANHQGSFGLVSVGAGVKQELTDATRLSRGDLIMFDGGVDLAGYLSDCGRTFVFGKANHNQLKLFNALRDAYEAMRDMLYPGTKIGDMFRVAQATVRSRGFPRYTRGHFGHSLGMDPAVEEPPHISADEKAILKPGMVLSLEAPSKTDRLGTLQIENMVLITEDGHESFNTLPYGLEAV
jgi:Xaa-Pro dipeptidase